MTQINRTMRYDILSTPVSSAPDPEAVHLLANAILALERKGVTRKDARAILFGRDSAGGPRSDEKDDEVDTIRAARQAMIERQMSAWKKPLKTTKAAVHRSPEDDGNDDPVRSASDGLRARQENAWKRPLKKDSR